MFTSSSQVKKNNEYGKSKLAAEKYVLSLKNQKNVSVHILRLPNVFGKWARPNYNSVVATFCYNIARDLPIKIDDTKASIDMVYIDDVVKQMINIMNSKNVTGTYLRCNPKYNITVGQLADQIKSFKKSRENLIVEPVGLGLIRALYSTYVSYLPKEEFVYPIKKHEDKRGSFVEIIKTKDSGQVSFFTAKEGVTRGEHYHHSKTEKFVIIKGKARFRFRHILTGEFYELCTTSEKFEIVESVPGWSHNITNVGKEDLLCLLWSNELFDHLNPDTFSSTLNSNT